MCLWFKRIWWASSQHRGRDVARALSNFDARLPNEVIELQKVWRFCHHKKVAGRVSTARLTGLALQRHFWGMAIDCVIESHATLLSVQSPQWPAKCQCLNNTHSPLVVGIQVVGAIQVVGLQWMTGVCECVDATSKRLVNPVARHLYTTCYTITMIAIQAHINGHWLHQVQNRKESVTDYAALLSEQLLFFSFTVALLLSLVVIITSHILSLISRLAPTKYGSTPSWSVSLIQRGSYCPGEQFELRTSSQIFCK